MESGSPTPREPDDAGAEVIGPSILAARRAQRAEEDLRSELDALRSQRDDLTSQLEELPAPPAAARAAREQPAGADDAEYRPPAPATRPRFWRDASDAQASTARH